MKQYFWIVHTIAIAVCAALAGSAAMNVVEAELLAPEPRGRIATAPRTPPRREPPRSKRGEPLVERNIFCSGCMPPSAESEALAALDDGVPDDTALPLSLVATTIAWNPARSFATIRNRSSARLGAYRAGDEIPQAGELLRIGPRYVYFENEKSDRVERIDLLAARADDRKRKRSPRRSPPRKSKLGDLDDAVTKVDDSHYEVDRAVLDKILANPKSLGRARIVPSRRNGKIDGFRVYRVRKSSPLAKIGIMNGDTIHSVNGFAITSPDKALEVYTNVRSASNITVSLTRRGKSRTISYSIR